MSCYFLQLVFLFFICLLFCCAVGEPAFAQNAVGTLQSSFVLFNTETKLKKTNQVTRPAAAHSAGDPRKDKSFTYPSFSYTGGVLIVFALGKENGGSPDKCYIVEGHIDLTDGSNQWTEKFSKTDNDDVWAKQVVTRINEKYCKNSFAVLVNKDNDIYLLLNSSGTEGSESEFNVVAGGVATRDSKKEITWKSSEPLTEQIETTTENSNNMNFVASEGSAIMVNNSLVVSMWYEKKDNDFISTIIKLSKQDGDNWEYISRKPFEKEAYPAIVEWKGKLIMMTSSSNGYRKVYESTDMGENWTEAVGSLSGVWGNTKERKTGEYGGQCGFITAEIGEGGKEKKVILFAQPVEIDNDKYELHLWVTDYQRVYDAGKIVADVKQKTSSTLLYAKENLFVAFESGDTDKTTITIAYFKGQLETIKNVLKTWTEQDEKLSKFCFAPGKMFTSEKACTPKIPTDGLVGFLSGNYSGGKWGDEYWCVNATVKEGTNVTNGLKFGGPGAGAKWPVGDQGQNQRYHFVNNEFTLVATVKIDNNANDKNSVLGIGLQSNSVNDKRFISLLCSKGKWAINVEKNEKPLNESTQVCEKGKIYNIAVALHNDKTLKIYIDGEQLTDLNDETMKIATSERITHFYFGADSDVQQTTSDTTITNVLLYNRLFTEEEINMFKPKQNNDPTQTVTENKKNGTEDKEKKETQSSSPPPTTEDSAVRVGVVGVLSFMLFGVFTLLGRYVY